MLIQGIHHVCIKCKKDEVEKVSIFMETCWGFLYCVPGESRSLRALCLTQEQDW